MSKNNFYIKFTWLMASKRKLNKISNYEEKFNDSSLLSSNKRNKKTEIVLISIITVLTDMLDIIYTWNVKWVQISFTYGILFIKYGWIIMLKNKTTKIY